SLCRRCDFQTEGQQCFSQVRPDSKANFGCAPKERSWLQTQRELRGLSLQGSRAFVALYAPLGNNVVDALLIRGCRDGTPVGMRASIQLAISGDAGHAPL